MHNKEREMPVLPLQEHIWLLLHTGFTWEEAARPPWPNNTESAIVMEGPHECFILLSGAGQDWCLGESLCPWDLSYRTLKHPGENGLARPQVSEREAMHTFMHECLLHALNGDGPDGFHLLMHYQWDLLYASQPQPRQKGWYHLFPSWVLLSTKT